jgi:hypothetical protein
MNAESTEAQRQFLTRVKAATFDDALDLLDSLVANSIQVGYKAGYDQGHADGYGEGLDYARAEATEVLADEARALENTRLSQ